MEIATATGRGRIIAQEGNFRMCVDDQARAAGAAELMQLALLILGAHTEKEAALEIKRMLAGV